MEMIIVSYIGKLQISAFSFHSQFSILYYMEKFVLSLFRPWNSMSIRDVLVLPNNFSYCTAQKIIPMLTGLHNFSYWQWIVSTSSSMNGPNNQTGLMASWHAGQECGRKKRRFFEVVMRMGLEKSLLRQKKLGNYSKEYCAKICWTKRYWRETPL